MNHPGLLEGVSPATRQSGARLQKAEWRAAAVAALGVVGTLASIPGSNRVDLLALSVPTVGLVVTMVGLIALYLEKWSDRFVRLVFAVGALALICLGFLMLGHENPIRITVGCFAPALLFAIAGVDLALSRRGQQAKVTT
jgi:hypothetical protein